MDRHTQFIVVLLFFSCLYKNVSRQEAGVVHIYVDISMVAA
jgi:hypothetical protein